MAHRGATTAGQRLYERFCRSEVSGAAHYWQSMNPAVKEDWERLGREWEALTDVLAQAAIVPSTGPATGILRVRVDKTHEILAAGEIPAEWREATNAP